MSSPNPSSSGQKRYLSIIALICSAHLINDATQSLLPSIYPILQKTYALNFLQIGVITAMFQVTGSLMQPLIGYYADKKPMPRLLSSSFLFALIGLLILSYTNNYYLFLLGSALLGLASSLFHPEASRITRFASGGKYGFAQSMFQIGGNTGTAVGPLLAAVFIYKQNQLAFITPFSIIGIVIILYVTSWYTKALHVQNKPYNEKIDNGLHKSKVVSSLIILLVLMFAKYVYLSTIQNYYPIYLIERYHVSIKTSQYMMFLFLSGVAMGTIFGGSLGDRIGAKNVIWFSILGVLPFTIALPFVSLTTTAILSFIIGAILASAFPAIVVYAQELIPGKVGTIGGAMYGFSYGIAALSSCLMGYIGDYIGLHKLFIISGYLPILGILAIFLPKFESKLTIDKT